MNQTRQPISPKLVIAALVVVGFVLRGLLPGRIAVEHFDEGVYASNIVSGVEYDYRYPSRHLFAPPLQPWLIEWSQVAWGINDLASVAVNLIAGGLTVLLVGLVARRWFGDRAGIAAAALAALSGIHILYSRTALTDPLLCLWMVAAVYGIWQSLVDGDWTWAVIAGLLTGAAWWTKYNGWLPLAIGISAAVPWLAIARGRERIRTTVICLTITVAVAALIWSPAWYNLPRGYGEVAANHRQYLVGLNRWPEALWRQMQNHRLLEGLSGITSLAEGVLAVGLFARGSAQPPSRADRFLRVAALAIGLTALASLSSSSVVLAALAAYWIWRHVKLRPADPPLDDEEAARQLALWLLAAWIVGLSLSTPLYTAYPRITLPWLVPIWLAGGAGIAWMVTGIQSRREESDASKPSRHTWNIAAAAVIVVGLAIVSFGRHWSAGSTWSGWQSRTGLADVAAEAKADIEKRLRQTGQSSSSGDYVVVVYGEPALFFQLRQLGIELALPVSSLRFAQPGLERPARPTFLLAGPHALGSPQFEEQLKTTAGRLKLLRTYEFTPSDFVVLNQYPPAELRTADGSPRRYAVRLYELE